MADLQRRPAPAGEGWLMRDGIRLHYLEWHPDQELRPALVLLHGLSSNARFFERLAARLPDRRLVCLDQRSHGLSDRPPTGYSISELVADAAQLVTTLGLERPVVGGHSWGAGIALALAAWRPDLCSGLAFIDAGLISLSRRMSKEETLHMMEPELPSYGRLAEAAAAVHGYLQEAWGEDLMPFVEAGLVQEGGRLVPTLTAPVRRQILLEMFDARPEELWAGLKVPVLLALASQTWEPFLTAKREGAEEVGRLLEDVTTTWYDSPHDIPVVCPDQLAGDLEMLCRRAAAHG